MFLKHHLEFFGLVFSKDGISPDPKQISALANSATPTTAREVRSLLGMANFSAQFIPTFATLTEPLRGLTHKNTVFTWNAEQENAYQQLKAALISQPVMNYFDPTSGSFSNSGHKGQKGLHKHKQSSSRALTLKVDTHRLRKKHSPLCGVLNTHWYTLTCIYMGHQRRLDSYSQSIMGNDRLITRAFSLTR